MALPCSQRREGVMRGDFGLEKGPVLVFFGWFLGACRPVFVIWVTFWGVCGGVWVWGESPLNLGCVAGVCAGLVERKSAGGLI